jgi:hypothetical protein
MRLKIMTTHGTLEKLRARRPGDFLSFGHDLEEVLVQLAHNGSFRDLTGEEGLEPTTNGFGDRYSTN